MPATDALRSATHLDVEALVRYWEDAVINGTIDADGALVPGRYDDLWKIRIDLATGRVEDWPEGVEAEIHYKVCDEGQYWLSNAAGIRVAKWRGYYVPDEFLTHGTEGFGDYIILSISGAGMIRDYRSPRIEEERWAAA
ncbi:hypothetical protein [Sphingomonas sp. 3-13AW]|uniref:hypothetical protein n=1 Tax=Sphingomonas sp. 3-13AW TaxID=3050450 RepID=UPI003BB510EA